MSGAWFYGVTSRTMTRSSPDNSMRNASLPPVTELDDILTEAAVAI